LQALQVRSGAVRPTGTPGGPQFLHDSGCPWERLNLREMAFGRRIANREWS